MDPFGVKSSIKTEMGEFAIYSLPKLFGQGIGRGDKLPVSIRVVLENVLRNMDGRAMSERDVKNLANWDPKAYDPVEVNFIPARVVLQDFTGVPCVVDLAALRNAMVRLGGDPKKINPIVPVDLVIDHSVQVDTFGTLDAISLNSRLEFERNMERYKFLHWGQKAFNNFKVVPPATGIVHQVNLEYLAPAVMTGDHRGERTAFFDTLVGTDSHTTMINGLGVLGWGVGGIEAEACMLGQPLSMVMPEVVGFKLTGQLSEGATATDLVLVVTEMLRKHGVVGKFVEFFGSALANISLPDRATIANMAPEYGATMGFFPIDDETLSYLERTGRSKELVNTVEVYCKEQGVFRTADTPDPEFNDVLELDLSTVQPSLAGPSRPQDRVLLRDMKTNFHHVLSAPQGPKGFALDEAALKRTGHIKDNGHSTEITHGAVVIAAITSCTNTSNPSVMVGAGLLAKKAVEKGLQRKSYVKSSLAPGSKVVTDYLNKAGLTEYLNALGFQTVGYGCTTCIGNSGPLPDPVREAVHEGDLVATSVLSGNRNFAGRISPDVRANFLASPPLVVAYALAGTVDIDLTNEPLGKDKDGNDVFLKDIWPTQQEIQEALQANLSPELYRKQYSNVYDGNPDWNKIPSPEGDVYEWEADSTYIAEPPFFQDLPAEPQPLKSIQGARVLVLGGDSITTDHISPAGSISPSSPAGQYLTAHGVERYMFNSYGSRRGHDAVMTRGTFANVRLRNLLVPGSEGGVTYHLPSGTEPMSIYDAAMKYQAEGTPLVILAGVDYGMGSSRDWAAKGTFLLGVRATIVESYERIHRSNLVMMGVLPLTFKEGQSWKSLGLTGHEHYDIPVDNNLKPGQMITVTATSPDGSKKTFEAKVRIDTETEMEYYRHGGILQMVLRNFLKA
jgi:aconitate hydratase